jgi:hypothetical protein
MNQKSNFRESRLWPHVLLYTHLTFISASENSSLNFHKHFQTLHSAIHANSSYYHGQYGSGEHHIYIKDTIQNTLSACTHNERCSNVSQAGLKL